MRSQRVRHRGVRAAVSVSVLLILVPPALRVLWHEGALSQWLGEPVLPPPPAADPAVEVAVLRDELARARAELEAFSRTAGLLVDPQASASHRRAARYRAMAVEVLPLSDPSPARHAMWVSLRGIGKLGGAHGGALGGDLGGDLGGANGGAHGSAHGGAHGGELGGECAVVAHGFLAGRLAGRPPGLSAARVSTLLDPLFRVRFQSGEVSGILWGTGRTGADGLPLLEIHHLTTPGALEAGAQVVSAGGDGVFPPGIPIGQVVACSSGSFSVRAALAPAAVTTAVLVEDLAQKDLAEALAQERGR